MREKTLKITPIKNGTVIDHIPSGMGLKVLSILGIKGDTNSTVSVLIHAQSTITGFKDVVKIEDRELQPKEVNKIALIAPNATINIIRNFEVVEKHKVKLPNNVQGIVKCENLNCISNTKEPIESRFIVLSRNPPKLRCYYCDRELKDVIENII